MTAAPRRRPSALLTLAWATSLVVVAAGSATAATVITSKQIKDGTIQSIDVKDGTLTGVDVKNSSLTGADVKNGSLGTADLAPALANGHLAGRIPSGTTVVAYLTEYRVGTGDHAVTVQLPAAAGADLQSNDVNFGSDGIPQTTDDDPACQGSVSAPTAPPGKVCLYLITRSNDITGIDGFGFGAGSDRSFGVRWTDVGVTGVQSNVELVWAYTAP